MPQSQNITINRANTVDAFAWAFNEDVESDVADLAANNFDGVVRNDNFDSARLNATPAPKPNLANIRQESMNIRLERLRAQLNPEGIRRASRQGAHSRNIKQKMRCLFVSFMRITHNLWTTVFAIPLTILKQALTTLTLYQVISVITRKGKKLCNKGKMSIESSYCGVKLEVHWEFLVQGHLGEQLIFRPSLIMMLIEAIHRILIFQQRDLIYSWSMFQARRKVMEEW